MNETPLPQRVGVGGGGGCLIQITFYDTFKRCGFLHAESSRDKRAVLVLLRSGRRTAEEGVMNQTYGRMNKTFFCAGCAGGAAPTRPQSLTLDVLSISEHDSKCQMLKSQWTVTRSRENVKTLRWMSAFWDGGQKLKEKKIPKKYLKNEIS